MDDLEALAKRGWGCDEPWCENTVKDGPLFRINDKDERGIFVCSGHYRPEN